MAASAGVRATAVIPLFFSSLIRFRCRQKIIMKYIFGEFDQIVGSNAHSTTDCGIRNFPVEYNFVILKTINHCIQEVGLPATKNVLQFDLGNTQWRIIADILTHTFIPNATGCCFCIANRHFIILVEARMAREKKTGWREMTITRQVFAFCGCDKL